jgi:hypothetical protein
MENHAQQTQWETYTRSWSETDPAKRMQWFEQCLSPLCAYTDPLTQTAGYEQLSDYMAELQKNVPGVKFITINYRNHHDRSLANWRMVDGNGDVLSQGTSYGLYGADGRLVQMTGFFDV